MRIWEEIPERLKVLLRPSLALLETTNSKEKALVIVLANMDECVRTSAALALLTKP